MSCVCLYQKGVCKVCRIEGVYCRYIQYITSLLRTWRHSRRRWWTEWQLCFHLKNKRFPEIFCHVARAQWEDDEEEEVEGDGLLKLGDRAESGLTWIISGSIYKLVYNILKIYIQDWLTFLACHLTKITNFSLSYF